MNQDELGEFKQAMDEDSDGCPRLMKNMILDDLGLGLIVDLLLGATNEKAARHNHSDFGLRRSGPLLRIYRLLSIPPGPGPMGPGTDGSANMVLKK